MEIFMSILNKSAEKKEFINNLFFNIYCLLMSALFIFRALPYFDQPGDQTWFAEEAIRTNYDYLGFAIDRYFTWSSRLLIESATMYFSVHQVRFGIAVFLALFVFWKCLVSLFLEDGDKHNKIRFLVPLIFILIFTGNFYSGAGLIPNMVNYFFPMVCFTFGWTLMKKNSKFYNVLSIFFIIFSCMQEQFTILTFLIFLYLLINHFLKKNKINLKYVCFVIISLLGIISAMISPGNKDRVITEIEVYYPTFDSISVFNKVYNGFMEANRVLFLNNTELNFLFLLLILLLIISIIRKKYGISILVSVIIFCTLFNKIGIDTPMNTIQKIINDYPDLQLFSKDYYLALYPVILYALFLLIIGFSLLTIFDDVETGLFSLILVMSGYLARMAVSFSPGVFVSGIRTFEPLIFTSFIVIILMINELSALYEKNLEGNE